MAKTVFISSETIESAINDLKMVEFCGKRATEAHHLFLYFLLRRAGVSEYDYITDSQFKQDAVREEIWEAMFELGALYNPYFEIGLKYSCFPFSGFGFLKQSEEKWSTDLFYNKATPICREEYPYRNINLVNRVFDSLDNAFVDKGLAYSNRNDGSKSYRFKQDVAHEISKQFRKRFPLRSFLLWLNRYKRFDEFFQTKDIWNFLKMDFLKRYHLEQRELDSLFEPTGVQHISFADEPIDGSRVRSILNLIDKPEILPLADEERTLMFDALTREDFENLTTGEAYLVNEDHLFVLLEKYHQVILQGVPGTGKSYMANKVGDRFDKVFKVMFHPNYTYQDFIVGKTMQNFSVIPQEGLLLRVIKECPNDHKGKVLLIIDEINRGHLASIFGETIYVLDRCNEVKIAFGDKEINLSLPENLYILGTMNTSDRSIALVDFAIRRRFAVVTLYPDYELIDSASTVIGSDSPILGKLLKKINSRIVEETKSEHFQLGHSFFLKPASSQWTLEEVREVLALRIAPMVEEFVMADVQKLRRILPKSLFLDQNAQSYLNHLQEFIEDDD